MTQDEIIELVQEAGIVQFNDGFIDITKDELDKFAKLVAAKAMKELENSLILMSEVNISNNFKQPQRTEQEPRNVRERWNIELDGDDLLVCFNDHEKSDKCEYERYSPQLEQNFCPRCGKRTKDLTHIHTCTPPQD
jgi:hypothetical protein